MLSFEIGGHGRVPFHDVLKERSKEEMCVKGKVNGGGNHSEEARVLAA